jgi:LmbE family N-acetylglucosaminyl deacetylase
VDVTTVFSRKMEAVAAHASQLHDAASLEPPTAIAAPGFLSMLEARARTAGALIGVTYGEPFMVDGPGNQDRYGRERRLQRVFS